MLFDLRSQNLEKFLLRKWHHIFDVVSIREGGQCVFNSFSSFKCYFFHYSTLLVEDEHCVSADDLFLEIGQPQSISGWGILGS